MFDGQDCKATSIQVDQEGIVFDSVRAGGGISLIKSHLSWPSTPSADPFRRNPEVASQLSIRNEPT